MSDLAVALAALAESLEPATVTERVRPAQVLDVTEILAMPLDRFAREGPCLKVRVPWLDVTLWFVPEECDAAAIERTGAGRGRVWTASELMSLMVVPDRTPAIIEAIARVKLAVDGDRRGTPAPAGARVSARRRDGGTAPEKPATAVVARPSTPTCPTCGCPVHPRPQT